MIPSTKRFLNTCPTKLDQNLAEDLEYDFNEDFDEKVHMPPFALSSDARSTHRVHLH